MNIKLNLSKQVYVFTLHTGNNPDVFHEVFVAFYKMIQTNTYMCVCVHKGREISKRLVYVKRPAQWFAKKEMTIALLTFVSNPIDDTENVCFEAMKNEKGA